MTENGKNLLIGIAFLAGLVMIGKLIDSIWPNNPPSSNSAMQTGVEYIGIGEGKAFSICTNLLKQTIKYPDKSQIPSVSNLSKPTEPEYFFSWGPHTEYMMLMNGMGNMVPASASCILEKMTGKPVSLSLDGTSIIK